MRSKRLKESTFTDEDGKTYQLEFQKGLTDSEIDGLKERFPNQNIDKEIIEILRETRGWDDYGLDMIHFDSIGQFGYPELSSNSLTLGHDGLGNYWILDLAEDGKPDKVFFACHDPAVFVIHSQNLNEYLHHLLESYQNPDGAYMNQVHGEIVATIWNENRLCSPKRARTRVSKTS